MSAAARVGIALLAGFVLVLVLASGAQAGTGGGEPSSGGPLPAPEEPSGEVRDTADEVLSRPEYQHEPTLIERAMDWISDRITDLFTVLGGGSGAGGLLGTVFVIGLLLLVGFLLFLLWRSRGIGRSVHADDGGGVEVTTSEGRVDWLARAEQAEADGRWRLSLRCRYRALTDALVAKGVLDDIPGRTSGEHRREVADRAPEASVPFSAAADLFDRAWYGNRPTGPDESARFQGFAADAVAVVQRPGRRPVDQLVAPR